MMILFFSGKRDPYIQKESSLKLYDSPMPQEDAVAGMVFIGQYINTFLVASVTFRWNDFVSA